MSGGGVDFEVPAGITVLYIENTTTADSFEVVLVPVLKQYDGVERRSPLGFVLKATDAAPRRLIGSFYAMDGRRLGDNNVVTYSLAPSTTAKSIGDLVAHYGSPGTPYHAWADCAEFRGVLIGGPLLLLDGNGPAVPIATEDPKEGGLRLNPGPVILGGPSGVWQPALGPGYTDPPVTGTSVSNISVGSSATAFDIDVTSSVMASLFVKWTQTFATNSVRNMRVQAYRKATTLDATPVTYTSQISSIDEVFTLTDAGSNTFTAHIELDQGLYSVVLSVPSGANAVQATSITWALQRYQ